MSHLGDRVAALVDGQLAPDAVQRAQSHLAGCAGCRELVEVERLTKSRLASLGTPEPGAELVARLFLMGGPEGPLPPRTERVPGSPRVRPVPLPPPPGRLPGSSRPAGRSPGRPARRRVRMVAAAAVVGALSLIGAGAAVLASGTPDGRPVAPAEIAITPSATTLTVPVGTGSTLSDR